MLQIKRIELSNFMKHRSLNLDFTSGLNAISGMNGMGKSTIITAIGFALFNYNVKQNQAQLISTERGTAKVELIFQINETEYKVVRSVGVSTFVSLYWNEEDEVKMLHSSKNVYAKISEILEINNLSRVFEDILSIRSSEIVSPFSSDLQRRRQFFIGSLGLEKYEEVWSGLRPVISNLEGRILSQNNSRDRGVKLRKQVTAWRLENETLENIIEINKKELGELFAEAAKLRVLRDKNEEQIKNKFRLEAELTVAKDRERSYQNRINYLESQLKKTKQLEICPSCGRPLDNDGKNHYNETKSSELKKSLREVGIQLKEVSEQITSIELRLRDYVEYDYEYKLHDIDNSILDAQKDIEISEHKIKLNDLAIETNLGDIKGIIDDLKKQSVSVKSVALIHSIREGMRTLSSTINSSMVEDISSVASHFLSEVLGSNSRIQIQNNYNINVVIEAETFEFNQLSDGTQIMVGLAIRLAMTRFCSDLGLVFLDEPTINLHSNVKASLLEAIKSLGFSQIFVISHDDTFVSSTDNLIRLGE